MRSGLAQRRADGLPAGASEAGRRMGMVSRFETIERNWCRTVPFTRGDRTWLSGR